MKWIVFTNNSTCFHVSIVYEKKLKAKTFNFCELKNTEWSVSYNPVEKNFFIWIEFANEVVFIGYFNIMTYDPEFATVMFQVIVNDQ